jgi:hypothetical protein
VADMPLCKIIMNKPDVIRSEDSGNTLTDANLKVVKSLIIPNGAGFAVAGLQDVDGHVYLKVAPESEAVVMQAYANGAISEFLSADMLAAVATSGLYSDLSGSPQLANVATSGKYADLSGLPNLSLYLTSVAWATIQDKPAFADVATSGKYTDLAGKPVFAAVATSGQYSDLGGKPDLSVYALASALDAINNAIAAMANQEAFDNIAQRNAYDVTKLPFSAFVTDDGDGKWALYQATSTGVNASYVKLSDPDLLNAAMTALQIANAYESNMDVNRFTNALRARLESLAIVAGSGSYNDLSDKPSIPSDTMDLTNRAGFITGYTEVDTLDTVCKRGADSNNTASTAYSIAAQTFFKISLRSVKRRIRDYAGHALKTINELRVRTYKYKNSDEGQIGFIIDEIKDKSLINNAGTAINTDSLLAVAVVAIQELTKRVEALEHERVA